ncbi:sigma factor-like helix-turn-helix DNA-binding protein [Dermacoccus sp. PE3]|uniref:sigma factor-like helix-turn-helix DNA-binding protein n=1 Tax=Dermacoccus sp. PE3 TaxID=1641401 RepID=UPI0009E21EED|nr:sigma factor-like helix-turn-helix DNA-binding protein [Dermacoccus sp. PE3]
MEQDRRDDTQATVTLTDAWLEDRRRLTCLAYDILGEWGRAEDVVSLAWERAHRHEGHVANPSAWLRTVTTRLAIDEARTARVRRESYVGTWLPEPVSSDGSSPEDLALDRAMLSLGLLRVLEELDPLERAVFVLREGFAVPYAEISECVGRAPAACRQIVSRAKRLLPSIDHAPIDEDRRVLSALVAAIVDGDASSAVDLISDGCVLWSDSGGTLRVAPRPIIGADKIVRFFLGVQRKNPVIRTQTVRVNDSVALLFEAADGLRLVTLERNARREVTGLQLHANPIKMKRVVST